MGQLQCALPPCSSDNEKKSPPDHLISESSNSLSHQPSLPSVPSLTASFHHLKQPSAAGYHRISILKGHSSYIFSLVLAGKHLYSGSYDNEIRAWNLDQTSHVYQTDNIVAIGSSAAKSLVVFGDRLFSAHHDHKICVWKIHGDTHPRKYHCITTFPTLNNRLLMLLSPKNYVRVRRNKTSTWIHHVDTVSALALSKDGSLLYSASWDRTFKIWRNSDFRCLESVDGAHDDAINALVLSTDGFVYTGSADKKIKVWKKHEGEKKHSLVTTLEIHKSAVNALALSSDGFVLYSGACDRSIIVWERDPNCEGGHMRVMGAIRGHNKAILCLAAVSDVLCSGSADNTVRVWRRGMDKSYACLAVLEGHSRPVKCLTAAVDCDDEEHNSASGTSYLVYSGSLDCSIQIWKIWVPFF
ncbi:hypothetical protein Nepgr_017195 [Nepenthes gracilis]|uniref:Uncharacterized protein n=1 Tax=Nepenthes gracilis TaxID=150966 RepID=A0AAD3SR68_NEPGR|nr:hypothetical protein Nepgr_017195 [Nepenthes gracilis]